MALVVGTDTYGTVSEATTYFAARPWASSWVGVSSDLKEAAMRFAAIQLDEMFIWRGTISDDDQLMSWGRDNVIDDEGRVVPDGDIPLKIKYAQFELAFQWAFADQMTPDPAYLTATDPTGGRELRREKLGPLERDYFQTNNYMFDLSNGRMRTKVLPLVNLYCKGYSDGTPGSVFKNIIQ